MTDPRTHRPPGYSGEAPYAGQQPGTPFGERAPQASQVAEQTGRKAAELADQARSATGKMADQAKTVMRQRVSERASRSALDVADFARVLRQTGRQLEGNAVSPLVNRTAEQLERVAELLDSNDPDELVHNVERFARQQPLLFLGGAFALGLAGARFIKSGAARDVSTSALYEETGAHEEFGGPGVEGGDLPPEFRP